MAEVITKAFYTSFVVWCLNSLNMFDSSIISFKQTVDTSKKGEIHYELYQFIYGWNLDDIKIISICI